MSILSFGRSTRLSKENADLASKIMQKFPALRIICNDFVLDIPAKVVDFTAILMNRCRFLCMNPKNPKLKKDLGHFFGKVLDDEPQYCSKESFCQLLLEFNSKLEASIGEQIAEDWLEQAEKASKGKRVALHKMANYYLERYPTEKTIQPAVGTKLNGNKEIEAIEKNASQEH